MNGPFIDYLDVADPRNDLGITTIRNNLVPMRPPIFPEYGVEFNIDDTNKIRLRDRIKDLADSGITRLADFATSPRPLATASRFGLGSLLFGLNPALGLISAFGLGPGAPKFFGTGQKSNLFDLMKQRREQKQRERMERAAALEREQALREIDRADSGFDDYQSGQGAGMGFGGGRSDPTDKS
tara:strand:- start:45 stop:593 length:549 start_codon:yes stop_codon:yes gene_type:complete